MRLTILFIICTLLLVAKVMHNFFKKDVGDKHTLTSHTHRIPKGGEQQHVIYVYPKNTQRRVRETPNIREQYREWLQNVENVNRILNH